MKKTNKVLLVVVIILVVLFGVGQFFTSSNIAVAPEPSSNSSSTNTPPPVPPTQVVRYIPEAIATSTPVEQGSCWTGSIAAAYRTDAWRCTVGNSISDPCFQIPSSANLLCNIDPSNPNSTSSFVLKLTKSLPAPQAFQGPIPSNWAWLVELGNGTLCSPFTGTRPFAADGESANYGCAPGPLGNDINILGDLNNASAAWTASVGTFSTPAASTSGLPVISSSSTVPVMEVWQ